MPTEQHVVENTAVNYMAYLSFATQSIYQIAPKVKIAFIRLDAFVLWTYLVMNVPSF